MLLKSLVGTDVIHLKNSDDAIELLKILPEIPLIITVSHIEQEAVAKSIQAFLGRQKLETKLIVLGGPVLIQENVIHMSDPINWESLISFAAKALKVSTQPVLGYEPIEYFPVRLQYFYEIQRTPCDVFIRLKNDSTEHSYVKLFHSGDSFDQAVIKKYELQSLSELFITKDTVGYFANFITNQMVERLERTNLDLEERIHATATAYELVQSSLQKLDGQGPWIELSSASIVSIIKSIITSPGTSAVLKLLLTEKIKYAYKHCHMVVLLCHYILLKQSWYKPDHLQTLTYVSFFSDITLKTPEQIRISCDEELAQASLSEKEKSEVKMAALDALDILDEHPEVTEYMRTVLLQSNGSMNGIGFVRNPDESLHPLSKVFIVADAFVKILLDEKAPSTKKEILPILSLRYTHPSYQKIIKTLEQKY